MLAVRSILSGGFLVGLAMGAGVALIDALYAAAGAAGAGAILQIEPVRVAFGALGAAVLIFIGYRTLWSAVRVRAGAEDVAEVSTPRSALKTAIAATASNPLTIASWAAIFAAASTASVAGTATGAALMVLGVLIGSFTWMALLSGTVAVARMRAGDGVRRVVDVISGIGLVVFGALLGWRTVRDA
jgi:putative LysE/RhtB family amino acid efflux pump